MFFYVSAAAYDLGIPGLQFGATLLATALGVTLALVTLGRFAKRRTGVRMGLVYQLFCFAAGPYAALAILGNGAGRRELGALLTLLGAGVLARLIDQFFWRGYIQERRGAPIPKLIREMTAGVLLIAAALLVLQGIYKVPVPGLLAASGVVGVILGLALQDTLGNIFGGLSIQLGRPFQVGDWLLINERHAQVIEINWRSTRCVTNDDVHLDVPNLQIVRQTVVNFHGGGPVHAMRLDVRVEYDTPPNVVMEMLVEAAVSADHVLGKPRPNIFLKEFGENGVVYEVRFWLDDHRMLNLAASSIRTNIWYALRRRRISIPTPTRVLQMEREPTSQQDERRRRQHSRATAAEEIMRAQPVFKSLEPAQLKRLVERCSLNHYGRGETIIREGMEGASMFVLLNGEARVSVLRGTQSTTVAMLNDGDCFGEMSLLTGERRSASVQAIGDCDVMEITKPVFAEFVAGDPSLLPKLSALLAQRQLETDGIVLASKLPEEVSAKEEEYRAGFLHRISAFFDL